MSRIGRAPHSLHGFFFLPDTYGEETAVNRQSDHHRIPRVTKQADTDQFGNNIQKVIRMSNDAKQETLFDALVRNNIDLHRPHITEFIDHVKQHDIGKCHHCRSPSRIMIEADT